MPSNQSKRKPITGAQYPPRNAEEGASNYGRREAENAGFPGLERPENPLNDMFRGGSVGLAQAAKVHTPQVVHTKGLQGGVGSATTSPPSARERLNQLGLSPEEINIALGEINASKDTNRIKSQARALHPGDSEKDKVKREISAHTLAVDQWVKEHNKKTRRAEENS